MKLDCRRCGTPIDIPAEATLSPTATLTCPGCGARYMRRSSSASGAVTGAPTIAPDSAGTSVGDKRPASSPAFPKSPAPSGPAAARTDDPAAAPATVHPTVAMSTGESTQFRSGDLVAGRYRVRRFIARGGMGEVYEAEDSELRQVVALKTVHPRDSRHELAIERFKREIHLARRVTHPNVCRIYDVGYHSTSTGGAVIFLSMELLEGETLSHLLKRRGHLEPEEMLPLALQMIDALDAAHAAGVVHRDFKSENVFLVPAPTGTRVVVTDFGVARGVDFDEFAAHVTVADAAVGTPAYMAPEQIEGAAITPAIDQYALGVVLFEGVTGRLPFAGDTPIATAVKRLTQVAPAADELRPGLDPRWVRVIRQCLSRRPEERFGTLREVREALEGAPPATTPSAPLAIEGTAPETRVEPSRAAAPRRRQLWLLAAVSVVLLIAVMQAVIRVRRSLESPLAAVASGDRREVAVVPFRNLAQRAEFEWLSVALAEMVASEVRAARGLSTLSGDTVARAGVDLGLGSAAALTSEHVDRLRERLGADFVVAGDFTVLGAGGSSNVRLAVRVEDTRSRRTLGEAVETGSEQELFGLVARVGERLRGLLGESGAKSGEAVATPRSPRAARFYSEGLLKLRAFDPQAALQLFEQAKEAEPNNPMIRSALASAWAALGFEQRANEEAQQALAMGADLPPEERFVVEALAAELRRDWPRATETWGRLRGAFPDNLDYGLKLARAQIESGQGAAALATLAALRELPEPDRDNPRIDLAEAAAALTASDFARQLEAARRAVPKAEALQAPLLVAEARVREAEALRRLGRPVEAEAASAAARELYRAAGDRVGEAATLVVAAGALFDRGELAAARAANEEALASYRVAGDRIGVARTLNGLAVLARNLGELERSRALYSEALSVLGEIDDRRGTAYTRGNLAAVSAEEGRLEEARAAVQESLRVFRELGDESGAADALLNLGIIEHQLGALDAAVTRLEEALSLKRQQGLKPGEATALAALGSVFLDRGAIPESRRQFDDAVRLATETDSRAALSNALAGLGELAIEAGDLPRAREHLARSLEIRMELGRGGKVDESRALLARLALEAGEPRAALGEIRTLVDEARSSRSPALATQIALLHARTLAAMGRAHEARAAVVEAEQLSARSEAPQTELDRAVVVMTLELAGARIGELEPTEVERLVLAARQRGFEGLALELEILRERRRLSRGEAGAKGALAELAAAASRRGLVRLESQAVRALDAS